MVKKRKAGIIMGRCRVILNPFEQYNSMSAIYGWGGGGGGRRGCDHKRLFAMKCHVMSSAELNPMTRNLLEY